MSHSRPAIILAAALLLTPVLARAAAPQPDFGDLPAYLRALNASPDPAALGLRSEIADGPAALARERALSARAGLPTTLAQLSASPPPEAQNAAPLYVQWDALRKAKPLTLPRFANVTASLSLQYAYTPAQLAEVRAALAARPDYTTLLNQATDRPRCVFVTDWTQFPQVDNFSHFAGLREAARTFRTEGFLLAKESRFEEAVTEQARGFALARHAADSDPNLIGFLVASAIDAITIDGIQDILCLAGPNAAVAAQVQAALDAHVQDFALGKALGGEGAMADGEIALMHRAKPAEFATVLGNDSPYRGKRLTTASRFTPAEQQTVSALLDAAEARALAEVRELAQAAALPRPAREAAYARIFTEAQNLQANPAYILSAAVSPAVTVSRPADPDRLRFGDQADRVPARHAVTRAGAALLTIRAKTGVFPDALPAGNMDPYTDQPLGYRREGADGFVIYSAGPTGDFDGGKRGDKRDPSQVLFRYPAQSPLPLPADAGK